MNNPSPAQTSGIQWPEFAVPKRAGREWLNANGFNQAINDCQAAYNRHVEVYDSHPTQTYLIDGWPRDKSRAINQQQDYIEGYKWAMSLIEKAFSQAQENKASATQASSTSPRKAKP